VKRSITEDMNLLWNITLFLTGCSLYVAGAIWVLHRHKKKDELISSSQPSSISEQNQQAAALDRPSTIGRLNPSQSRAQRARIKTIEDTLRNVPGGVTRIAANTDSVDVEFSEMPSTVQAQGAAYEINEPALASRSRKRLDNLV
jgi:hypothetical protein